MKKLLILNLFILFVLAIEAQQIPLQNNKPMLPKKYSYIDSATLDRIFLQKKFTQLFPKDTIHLPDNIDNMPVLKREQQLTFTGNNNKGFDVYTSTPNNMRVLKPDSAFHSFMPTGKYEILKREEH